MHLTLFVTARAAHSIFLGFQAFGFFGPEFRPKNFFGPKSVFGQSDQVALDQGTLRIVSAPRTKVSLAKITEVLFQLNFGLKWPFFVLSWANSDHFRNDCPDKVSLVRMVLQTWSDIQSASATLSDPGLTFKRRTGSAKSDKQYKNIKSGLMVRYCGLSDHTDQVGKVRNVGPCGLDRLIRQSDVLGISYFRAILTIKATRLSNVNRNSFKLNKI